MRLSAIVLLLLAVASPASAAPNVLVVLTDDMRADDLAYMPKTLALLGTQGMTFTQFFVSSPLCCPSRATFFRGQYAHNHGVWVNAAYHRLRPLEEGTLATELQSLGYRTGLVGKYANGYGKQGDLHIPPGWGAWAALLSGVTYLHSIFNDNGVRVDNPDTYQTDLIRDRAVAFIAASPSPWFLYVAPNAPHLPSTPAPRHAGLFTDVPLPRPPSFDVVEDTKPAWMRALPPLTVEEIAAMEEQHRNRLRTLQSLDEAIEAMVAALTTAGQLDNTYIVFTSDNGYHLGTHRMRGKPYQRTWKETPYDEDVRVPLLIRGPGIATGSTTAKLSVNVDLAPTILRLAGVKPRAWMDGRALDRTLFGGTLGGRTSVLLEMRPARKALPPPGFTGLRTARYLYVQWFTGERELYDRSVDPYELTNLIATADTCVVEALGARLMEMKRCERAACRVAEALPLPVCAQ